MCAIKGSPTDGTQKGGLREPAMSICKRSDGRWCVKTKDELRPGKYIQRTFRTQKEAKEYERAARHGAPKDERLTVLETVKLSHEKWAWCRGREDATTHRDMLWTYPTCVFLY